MAHYLPRWLNWIGFDVVHELDVELSNCDLLAKTSYLILVVIKLELACAKGRWVLHESV